MKRIWSQWGSLIWPLVAFKAGYWLLLLLAVYLGQEQGYGEIGRLPQRWPLHGGLSFASHFANWDAGYYLYLSAVGYQAGDDSCAFYPLFPLCIRWFSDAFGGDHLVFGLILSNLFSLAGFMLFFHQLRERFDWPVAKLAMTFFLLFPGALFYQFVYSETLFFLLVMALWFGLEHRRYRLAWVSAFLLPQARAIGLFCLLPIAWHCLTQSPPQFIRNFLFSRPRLRSWLAVSRPANITSNEPQPQSVWPASGLPVAGTLDSKENLMFEQRVFSFNNSSLRAWSLLFAPLAGLLTYLTLLGCWTSNPFEGYAAQNHWRTHSFTNLVNVPKFIIAFFSPSKWHGFQGSVLDRCMFALLLNCLPSIWRLDKSVFCWSLMLGIVPAMSGTFTSYTRFASAVFPMFIAMAIYFKPPRRRYCRKIILLVFATLHTILLWRYVTCRWAN